MTQVSFNVPAQRNRRKQIFCQHENEGRSVLQQLDGVETLSGRFRVRLVETVDGQDYKFQAWVEKHEPKLPAESDSKVLAAYVSSGRPKELFYQALNDVQPLTQYEIGLLETGKVEYPRNRRFFELTKALLREARFDVILAEAKADELEGRKARVNQTARLIHRIMEAIKTPVSALKER